MKLNTGARCHDLYPKMETEKLFTQAREYDIYQVQLAFEEPISGYDFVTGRYSSGFTRTVARELEKSQIHVAVLGCYINSTSPVEPRRQAEVVRFIEHTKYIRIIRVDMVGTKAGYLGSDFRVTGESYTEDTYRLLLRSVREIVAAAEKLGVIAEMEGAFDHTLYSPARIKRFLEDIDFPNVEVTLDAVNLIHPHQMGPEIQRQVIDRAFAYYGDRIGVLHVKDFVSDGQEQLFRHMGGGLFRYEPLMKHVKERKPCIAMLPESSDRGRYRKNVRFF